MNTPTSAAPADSTAVVESPSRLAPSATVEEHEAYGRSLRLTVSLESHAQLPVAVDRPSPVDLLEEQSASRVPDLVPIRYGRMLVSPFTFYRGAARIMASDLAATPRTGLEVQVCGDAHLSNFGLFATPERRLVFDVNDFDETLPGPWEWDVKRLITSLVIAAQDNDYSNKQIRKIALNGAATYRRTMTDFAQMRNVDVWYAHLDLDDFQEQIDAQLDPKRRKALARGFAKARTRDSMQALSKLTALHNGQRRFIDDPPLIVRMDELLTPDERQIFRDRYRSMFDGYLRSLQSDLRLLLDRYRFADMARKVVGVGSVGTRCWVALLLGRDQNDPLFLQIKEAQPSVLAEFLRPSVFDNEGERVVTGQRRIQEASDMFLGWLRAQGADGLERDFYFRQLKDWKFSLDIASLRPKGMVAYARACAWALARGHARTGDRIAIAAYLGDTDTFDHALLDFAKSYAGLNARDHLVLTDAVSSGRITAVTGV